MSRIVADIQHGARRPGSLVAYVAGVPGERGGLLAEASTSARAASRRRRRCETAARSDRVAEDRALAPLGGGRPGGSSPQDAAAPCRAVGAILGRMSC